MVGGRALLPRTVIQSIKIKVGLMLNIQELNNYVTCHSRGDAIHVSGKTLQEWRQMMGALTMVNLKSTCLQLCAAEKLEIQVKLQR